jgi:hypothetical protein
LILCFSGEVTTYTVEVMRNEQQNYAVMAATGLFVLLSLPAFARENAIARQNAGQSPLHDGGAGPCDPGLESPDLVNGVDVGGHPVAPAGPQARMPVPDQILVPLRNGGRRGRSGDAPIVALDGRALDPLLTPLPACPPGKR